MRTLIVVGATLTLLVAASGCGQDSGKGQLTLEPAGAEVGLVGRKKLTLKGGGQAVFRTGGVVSDRLGSSQR